MNGDAGSGSMATADFLPATEDAQRRLNRELRAIRDCNQALIRAEDEQTLYREICRIVCDVAGYRLAWVGCPERDEAKTVRPLAWAGAEDGYLSCALITWADTERGRGPTGIAIRSGVAACVQDFATDSAAIPWRDGALRRGYRSSIALPLKGREGEVFGVLSIYAAAAGAFTADEVRLLESMAEDIAFGVAALRTRAQRREAETQLLASESRFRKLVENLPDFIVRYDKDLRRTYVNPVWEAASGLSAAEVINVPVEATPKVPKSSPSRLRRAGRGEERASRGLGRIRREVPGDRGCHLGRRGKGARPDRHRHPYRQTPGHR